MVGPEAPLAAGVGDALRQAGIAVFGPGADGAQLEASKAWNKVSKEESPNPPYAKAFDNSTSSKLMKGVLGVGNVDTITFAPSSMEMVKASSTMMFPYQYGVASEEVGKPLVSAHYTVHFAWFGGESDVTMNYLTNEREMSAETTMGQGIQVIPGAAVVFTLDDIGVVDTLCFVPWYWLPVM